MEAIRRRADVQLEGTLEEKVFEGFSTDLYLFRDERIGMVTIGVHSTSDMELGKEYGILASLFGKITTNSSGKTIYSNRLTVEDYKLKGEDE